MGKILKKESRLLFELLIEILIFFFMYTAFDIKEVMSIGFERYLFIFFMMYIILRDKVHNNLIWQDAKNIVIFYLVLFIVSLVVRPMKQLTIDIVGDNFFFMLFTYLLVLLFKKLLHTILFESLADNVLIIGTGHNAELIANVCKNNSYALMNVKGFLSVKGARLETKQDEVVTKKIIKYKELDEFLKDNSIDVALIAIPQISKNDLAKINEDLKNKVRVIKYMPHVNGMYSYDTRIEDYDGLLLVCNREIKSTFYSAIIKRIIDIIIGLIGCVFLLPLTIILKLLYLKTGDKDPMFFKQERIGIKGKKIIIYKYRSMIPNAEAVLEELMKKDPKIRKEYLENKKLEHDPRITKIGQFIRKTSIDEFPQFINVLKGDMSFVGPRPYLFREIEDMGNFYDSIIQTKPGITGMWQVSGRSDIAFARRCKLDEYYAKNQNFWLDFTITVKTIKVVTSNVGAK